MGCAVNNLVIIKGSERDVLRFKADAFEDESNAFNFDQLLPFSDEELMSTLEGQHLVENIDRAIDLRIRYYGNKWGSGFSVIFDETATEIHYFFNSKNTLANIKYIAQKYNNLEFTHFSVNYCNDYTYYFFKRYINGKDLYSEYDHFWGIYSLDFDLEPETTRNTPAHLEELLYKFRYFKERKQKDYEDVYRSSMDNVCNIPSTQFANKEFYKIFNRKQFLTENIAFYNRLFELENKLWSKDLEFAKTIGYPLKINAQHISKIINCATEKNESQCLKNEIINLFKTIKKRDFIINDWEEQFIYHVYSKGVINRDAKQFSIEYTKNRIDRFTEFLSNYNKYVTLLKEYEGVKPCCYLAENDPFFEYFITEEKLIDIKLHNSYNNYRYQVQASYESEDYYEEIMRATLKGCQLSGNFEKTTLLIIDRIALEQKVEKNLEICRNKFKAYPFIICPEINLNLNEMLMEIIGINVNKDGSISYNSTLNITNIQ